MGLICSRGDITLLCRQQCMLLPRVPELLCCLGAFTTWVKPSWDSSPPGRGGCALSHIGSWFPRFANVSTNHCANVRWINLHFESTNSYNHVGGEQQPRPFSSRSMSWCNFSLDSLIAGRVGHLWWWAALSPGGLSARSGSRPQPCCFLLGTGMLFDSPTYQVPVILLQSQGQRQPCSG